MYLLGSDPTRHSDPNRFLDQLRSPQPAPGGDGSRLLLRFPSILFRSLGEAPSMASLVGSPARSRQSALLPFLFVVILVLSPFLVSAFDEARRIRLREEVRRMWDLWSLNYCVSSVYLLWLFFKFASELSLVLGLNGHWMKWDRFEKWRKINC